MRERISISVNAAERRMIAALQERGGFSSLSSVVKASVLLCAEMTGRNEIDRIFDELSSVQRPTYDKSDLTIKR